LTQERLAERASVSAKTVSDLECHPERTPRLETVTLLADALGLPPEQRARLFAAARPETTLPAGPAAAEPSQSVPSDPPASRLGSRSIADALFAQLQPTPLLGRATQLESLVGLMAQAGTRLLTLTGPAGVGKTRLALAAGARLVPTFADGIVFVDLAVVRDPALVLPTVARHLGLIDPGRSALLERQQESLADLAMLLILDNFEHVLPAAADLPPLIAAAGRTKVLITSRTPLHLRMERTFRVPPLALPDLNRLPPLDELVQVPSVALFIERARAQRPDFQLTAEQALLVARLVAALDGLPLAIELAAARAEVLPLAVIVQRLQDRLRLLRWEAPDLPPRQRSLEATINWSYDLLPAAGQRLFRHLGVFVGRVSLAAIRAVLGEEDEEQTLAGLVALAEWGLLLPMGEESGDPEPSFRMLETTRDFAREQLAAQGELVAAQRAHAGYFLALAERAQPELSRRQQRLWHRRLQQEHDNLRLALRWLLEGGNVEAALRLATALGGFWYQSGYHVEGWHWLEEALSKAAAADPALRVRALQQAASLVTNPAALDPARPLLAEALALAEQHQDARAIAATLTYLGQVAVIGYDWAATARLSEEAVIRWAKLGWPNDAPEVGLALQLRSLAAFGQRDYERAAALGWDALEYSEARGDAYKAGFNRFALALMVRELGDLATAVQLLRDGLGVSKDFQVHWHLSVGVDATLLLVGDAAEPGKRARLLQAARTLHQAFGRDSGIIEHDQAFGRDSGMLEHLSGRQLPSAGAKLPQEVAATGQEERRAPAPMEVADLVDLALALLDDFTQGLPNLRIAAPAEAGQRPARSARQAPSKGSGQAPLTEREQEVLRLVAEGLTSKQIGKRLFLSPRTIEHHITSMFAKLGVDSRAGLVALATRRGLV
jgi:predicted ATPase/DNA-binding CsgD family transcriptional regulator/transcriptional regulator with XRE-family HTH domain